jgi:hypothetical protein
MSRLATAPPVEFQRRLLGNHERAGVRRTHRGSCQRIVAYHSRLPAGDGISRVIMCRIAAFGNRHSPELLPLRACVCQSPGAAAIVAHLPSHDLQFGFLLGIGINLVASRDLVQSRSDDVHRSSAHKESAQNR